MKDLIFSFHDRPPYQSKGINTCSVAIHPQLGCNPGRGLTSVSFRVGRKVVDKLGWIPGKTRIQFIERDGVIIFGTESGQWKLCGEHNGGLAGRFAIAGSYFQNPPKKRVRTIQIPHRIMSSNGSKFLVIQSSPTTFGAA